MRECPHLIISPYEAMKEVTDSIIATVVLLSVFVPTAFVGGITGQLYRQFALTIATAKVFSSINALTLSTALSALILRSSTKRPNLFVHNFSDYNGFRGSPP